MSGLSDSDSVGGSSDSEGLGRGDGIHETADLREYGRCIGVDLDTDVDLQWVVLEGLSAALPPSWTQHSDDHGRVYFFNQVTQESSWSHPMDSVFKEIVELVKALRAEQPAASSVRRAEAVQAHLHDVQQRAVRQLEGWSGPYPSDAGQYYYNATLGVSTWDNPVEELQQELLIRQQVLQRCLLPDQKSHGALLADGEGAVGLTPLPLGLAAPTADAVKDPPMSPSSARSFATARSGCSARTAGGRSPRRSSRMSALGDSARSGDMDDLLPPARARRPPADAERRDSGELVAPLPELPEQDPESPEPPLGQPRPLATAGAAGAGDRSPAQESLASDPVTRHPTVKTDRPTVASPVLRDPACTPWRSGFDGPPSVPVRAPQATAGAPAAPPKRAAVRGRPGGAEDGDGDDGELEITFGKTNSLQGALEAELRASGDAAAAAAAAAALPQFGTASGQR